MENKNQISLIRKTLYGIMLLGVWIFFSAFDVGNLPSAHALESTTATPTEKVTPTETPTPTEDHGNRVLENKDYPIQALASPIQILSEGNIYFLKIDLQDSRVKIRVGLANNDSGGYEILSSMKNRYTNKGYAEWAMINGDYFGTTSPSGPCPSNVNCAQGLTYIDGVRRENWFEYGTTWPVRSNVGFDASKWIQMAIGDAQSKRNMTIAGGPWIVKDGGSPTCSGDYINGTTYFSTGEQFTGDQRWYCTTTSNITMTGYSSDGRYLYMGLSSGGMNVVQLGQWLKDRGASNVMKMDGGGSGGIYYNDVLQKGANTRPIVNHLAVIVENTPPDPTGNWTANYYDTIDRWWDTNNSGNFKCSENINGPTLDKNYGSSAPCGGMDGETWIGDYTGTINFSSGNYVFRVEHDDGLKLWLNGQNIADRGSSGADWICPARSLIGNNSLRVMLREDGGDARVKVNWTTDASVCTPPPSANFDAWPLSGTSPFTTTMHIVDMSNITNCFWDYGDSQTSSTCTQTHDHTYNNAGTYTVNLNVSGPGGSNSMIRTNYITVNMPSFTMTVNKAGTGSGTVTSNPAGISCGSDCSEAYASNTQVTLTATPTAPSTFVGWSGAGCSGTETCTVTMSSAQAVTATFSSLGNQTLTVNKSGTGSGTVTSSPSGINCGSTCVASFTSGTVISLTATPTTGHTFAGWSGGGCSGTEICTVTMNAAQSVTATFTIVPVYPTGWSIVSTTPSLTLWDVDVVSENHARIAGGWCCNPWISTIKEWNGAQWQELAHSGQYQLFTLDAVNDNDIWYGGQFGELIHYYNGSYQRINNVTSIDIKKIEMVSSQEGWAITSSGYPNNTSEILHFVNGTWQNYINLGSVGLSTLDMVSASDGWIGGMDGRIYRYQNGTWSSVLSPVTSSIYAIYMLSANDGWAGTRNGQMLHYLNGTWSVHSTPAAGWEINGIDMLSATEGWAVGGNGLIFHFLNGQWTPYDNPATGAYLTDIEMISPTEGWAVGGFDGVLLRYHGPNQTLTVSKSGIGSGMVASSPAGINCGSTCSYAFSYNTFVTLTATPTAPSTFGGWGGGGCSGTGTCIVTMSSAKSVTANFNPPGNQPLTVSKSGTGSGIVTSSPAGINCGATCSYAFAYNTVVTLTATPTSPSTFGGWSGGGCSGTGTCTVTMSSAQSVTATFTAPNAGGGSTTGVFRPSNGLLYLKNANTTGFADVAINYGTAGDYPIAGDWDGNGTATIGIYRNGTFYLRNSNTLGFADIVFAFGTPGDQPVAGDWDGDGVDTIGVYSNGQFLLRNSNSAGAAYMSFYLGNPGDVGIAGDWNGDGMDTTGVFRPSNGIIFLKNANTTGFADVALNYGLSGDMPVTGDWNNDGIDTIGVYRNAQFLLRNSNTIGFAEIVFGLGNPGDMPISGNWDGIP